MRQDVRNKHASKSFADTISVRGECWPWHVTSHSLLRRCASLQAEPHVLRCGLRERNCSSALRTLFSLRTCAAVVQVWDMRKEQRLRVINAHQGLVLALDWHPEDTCARDQLRAHSCSQTRRAVTLWQVAVLIAQSK